MTSLSNLSTTAIKDGHQGHPPHPHTHHASSSSSATSTNTLDAERADRISRLAGLDRVATVRQGENYGGPTSNSLNHGGNYIAQPPPLPHQSQTQAPGYFDNAGGLLGKERSTVGSASATGSVGGERTTWASGTWASGSDVDKMSVSEDQDPDDGRADGDDDGDGVSSAGLSDEGNASLVGFGEGAGSTVSGPVSTSGRGTSRSGGFSSPTTVGKGAYGGGGSVPMQGVRGNNGGGMTGMETAERIVRERMDDGGNGGSRRTLESPEDGNGSGKFYFEEK